FNLYAYIVIVGADMPARSMIMKSLGKSAYRYCEYCYARGLRNKGMYCPFEPTQDPPEREKLSKTSGYPWSSMSRTNLLMRTNLQYKKIGSHIVTDMCDDCRKKYGVRGVIIIGNLALIDLPRSFPPDLMHLFYENIFPALFRHYRGVSKAGMD
ncbi:hypothetical protein EDC01DRAFT_594496, partial [Geopyxis carbonaria]